MSDTSDITPHGKENHFDRPTTERVKKALRSSAAEGTAYGAFMGFGDHYIVAFAVALQTSSFLIGILCSVPGFLAALAQLWDAALVRRFKSRKSVVLIFGMAQGLMFLPMLSLAFISPGSASWWLVASATLYSIFGAMVSPAWGSIIAEIVPENLRGKYFSLRGRLSTLSNVAAFLLAGIVLNSLARGAMWGFAILFGAAVLARLVSWGFLTRLYERHVHEDSDCRVPVKEFLGALPSTNLGKYMLFLFAMSLAVNIASPYFTVYELRDLKFSYLTFAILETASSLAMVFAITRWGKLADRAGNFKMLALASALIPLVPLLWMFSANRVYLGFIQVFSGIAWSGFNLCTLNYLYDATNSTNRTRYLAYFNAGNGLATGVGALLGGYLAPHLPTVMGYQTLTLFLISGLARCAVTVVFLPQIREVRRVSKLSAAELFHLLTGGRPLNRRTSHRRNIQVHQHEPDGECKV
ncbi:MAG: MFS transporter [Dehalococcoidia bacterium]|nr:MFS transporter [Dehalococcoidia bacterium]